MPEREVHWTPGTLWDGRVRPEGAGPTTAALALLGVSWLARLISSRPLRARPATQRSLMRALGRLVRAHLRVRLEVSGLEHLKTGDVYVVAPLHEGLLDPLVLLSLPLPLRFAARDELFEWPLVGNVLHATRQIPVSPEHGTRSYRTLLRQAREAVAAGESVVVFPQGTVLGIETDFTGGAFHLARTLNVPLLPVVLTGTHHVWEWPFTPTLRYGQRVSVQVLPPVPASTLNTHDIETVRITCRRAMKAAALDARVAPPRSFVPDRDGWWDGYRFEIDPDWPQLHAALRARRLRSDGPETENSQLKEQHT